MMDELSRMVDEALEERPEVAGFQPHLEEGMAEFLEEIEPPSGSYHPGAMVELAQQSVAVQLEIDNRIRGERSAYFSLYLRLKDSIDKVLGRSRLSDSKLLEVQVDIIEDMAGQAGSLATYSRDILTNLQAYRDRVKLERASSVSEMNGREGEFQKKKEIYDRLEKALQNTSRSDPQYYIDEVKLDRLRRQIQELEHSYDMSMDSVGFNIKESRLLERLETAFTESTHASEKLLRDVNALRRNVRQTRDAYETMRYQSGSTSALNGAVSAMTRQVLSLYDRLGSTMASAYDSPISEYFEKSSDLLSELIGKVQSASRKHRIDTRKSVIGYLDG